MPKLPAEKRSSVLEVAEKDTFNRGELVIPKVTKHRIVFKHHIKLALILLGVCIILAGIFVSAKKFIAVDKQEDARQESNVVEFKEPNPAVLKYPNLEFATHMIVDSVDKEKRIIYGKRINFETQESTEVAVRVIDSTEITRQPSRGEASPTPDIRTLEDIKQGNLLVILATENPNENKNLNARNIEIR